MSNQPYTVLLDAPATATSRIPIARLGEYKDKRYGEFSITKDDVADWQRNLEKLPGGKALIDEDHSSSKTPRRTEADGWVTGVELDGKQVYGQVEWTPRGKAAVEEKRYLFTSPTYGPYTDDSGTTHKNTLSAVALTNKPFLTSMPQIMLASDEAISQALEADPAAALYQKALDGELGADVQAIALGSPEDESVTSAIAGAVKAVHSAISAQAADPDKADPNDQAVLRALRRAASSLDDAEAAQARDNDNKKPSMMLELEDDGTVVLDTLTADARNNLKDGDFALPGRRYPIHDLSHAKNALARVAQNGSTDEQNQVKAAVYRRFPALKPAGKNLDTSDSPRQMFTEADIKALATLAGITDETQVTRLVELGTAEDAETAKVLEAIEAAKPEAPAEKTLEEQAEETGAKLLSAEDHAELTRKAGENADLQRQLDEAKGEGVTKTLEEIAAEAGKSIIDPERLTALEQSATKVTALEVSVNKLRDDAEAAQKELAASVFETAYDKAENEGKAVPAQKDRMKGFYELDAEGTLAMLEEAPPMLNMRAKGANVPPRGEGLPEDVRTKGSAEAIAEYELEARVEAYKGENPKADYATALEAVAGVSIPGMVGVI